MSLIKMSVSRVKIEIFQKNLIFTKQFLCTVLWKAINYIQLNSKTIFTCTNPVFRSCFLVGSIGIRLGRQFLVIGNLIFCDCGILTNEAICLLLLGFNEINPGGAPTIFGLICCKTVLPDVRMGLFNWVIVNAVFDFAILCPEDGDVTAKFVVLTANLFIVDAVTMGRWMLFVEEFWSAIYVIDYINSWWLMYNLH